MSKTLRQRAAHALRASNDSGEGQIVALADGFRTGLARSSEPRNCEAQPSHMFSLVHDMTGDNSTATAIRSSTVAMGPRLTRAS